MAERRMFAKTIIDSDAFLEMPMSARLLYYDLSMRADDDGFNNSPKKVMRAIGASNDDLSILVARKFVIPFENGVVVIKHWQIHNYIRKDTYKETTYKEQKAMLELDENKAYRLMDFDRVRAVDEPSTQVSIGKGSIELGKDSIVEGSVDDAAATSTEENQLKCIGGKLGKGVVYLSDNQFNDLLERLGLDTFNRYVERLANFIINKNAYVHNHYEMILKWFAEDSAVKPTVTGRASTKQSQNKYDVFESELIKKIQNAQGEA